MTCRAVGAALGIGATVLLLCVACGRGSAPAVQREASPSLNGLPPLSKLPPTGAIRIASAAQTYELLNDDPTLQSASGVVLQNQQLTLTAGAGKLAWAIWAVSGFDRAFDLSASLKVEALYPVWVAYADFSVGRWQLVKVSGSGSDAITLGDATGPEVSPSNTAYIAVLQTNGFADVTLLELAAQQLLHIPPVGNFQATDGEFSNRVELSWTRSPKATSYELYRDDLAAPFITKISGAASRYSDTTVPDTLVHTYWLRGVDDFGADGTAGPEAGNLSGVAPSAVWDQWRGNAQRTGKTAAIGPQGAPHIKWSAGPDLPVYSEPALSADGQHAYFCAGDPPSLCALNCADQSIAWTFAMDSKSCARPAVGNGRIVVASFLGIVYCLDANGSELWRYDMLAGVTARPAITALGEVYASDDLGGLQRLDASGNLTWKVNLPSPVRWPNEIAADLAGNCYVLSGGHDSFGNTTGTLYSYSPSGQLRWQYPRPVSYLMAGDFAQPMYVLAYGDLGAELRRVNPDGSDAWTLDARTESILAMPTVDATGELLCPVTAGLGGEYVAVYGTDGTRLGQTSASLAPLSSAVRAASGEVYHFGDRKLYTDILDPSDPQQVTSRIGSSANYRGRPALDANGQVWALNAPADSFLGNQDLGGRMVVADPASGAYTRFGFTDATPGAAVCSSNGNSYITFDDRLYCFSSGGLELWHAEAGDPLCDALAVDVTQAYVATRNPAGSQSQAQESLLAYTLAGSPAWSLAAPDVEFSEPLALSGGELYASDNSALYSITLAGALDHTLASGVPNRYGPAVSAAPLVLTAFRADAAALHLDGSAAWTYTPPGFGPLDLLCAEDGSTLLWQDTLQRLNATGQFVWATPALGFIGPPTADGTASYAIGGDVLSRKLYRFNADGSPRWQVDLSLDTSPWATIDGSGSLYLMDAGVLRAVSPDGAERWRLPLEDTTAPVTVMPSGDLLVQGAGAKLICVGD